MAESRLGNGLPSPEILFFYLKSSRDPAIYSYNQWSMCLRIGKATSKSILTTANFHNQASDFDCTSSLA